MFVAPDVSPSRKDVLRMVTAQGAHVVPERDDADLVLDNDANAATSKTGTVRPSTWLFDALTWGVAAPAPN